MLEKDKILKALRKEAAKEKVFSEEEIEEYASDLYEMQYENDKGRWVSMTGTRSDERPFVKAWKFCGKVITEITWTTRVKVYDYETKEVYFL